MLRTMDDHALTTIPALHGRHTKLWRAVTMELRIPYFIISHAVEEDGIWLHENCLLWREADVVDFCRDVHGDSNRKISQLSMLLPAESGRWVIEEIEEVWSSTSVSECPAIFFSSDQRQLGCRTNSPVNSPAKVNQKIYTRRHV